MKTAELTGADLALWVARAQKYEAIIGGDGLCYLAPHGCMAPAYAPHENWAQGGSLIGKFDIGFGLYQPPSEKYFAVIGLNEASGIGSGDTHLIAACRAIVASVYGAEVPDEVEP